MKFLLTMTDEVDLGLLHETLLHLMTEHPPLVIKITVELETPCYDLGSSEQLPEGSPDATSSQEPPEKTADGKAQEPSKSEEEI